MARTIKNLFDVIRGKKKIVFVKKNKNKQYYSVPAKQHAHSYQKLICVTGFGHSGSGTIIDFLSEFDNCTVYGHHDVNGSGYTEKSVAHSEIDFIRRVGGIVDLEQALHSNNQDFAIKLFLHVAEGYYRHGGIYTDEFWQLTNKFIDDIVDYRLPTSNGFEGLDMLTFHTPWPQYINLSSPLCTNTSPQQRYRYSLKKLSPKEYRKIASNYLLSFLKTIESKEFLVLDQALSTPIPNIEQKNDLMGDFKLVCVYRDPRDVFATGIILNEAWIPKDPNTFVKWYLKYTGSYIDEKHPNLLIIRFEDFVLQYDKTATQILNFIHNDNKHHQSKKKYFDPERSKKNIGIYKTLANQDEINYIEEQLRKYCYYDTPNN